MSVPITISVTHLHSLHRREVLTREVLTNPDFIELVESLAEEIRVLLASDNENLSERMADLVVDIFRPDSEMFDTEEGIQHLQELELTVTRLALEELAPLLVRICITGDWKEQS